MIEKLRSATKDLHEAIEKDNLASKIMDHSITLKNYKLLLLQNYIAYRASEREISRFGTVEGKPEKHQQIAKDLQGLEVSLPNIFDFEKTFTCKNEMEALGVAYVVEGSAMGGLMIGKELKKCQHLANIPDQHFFSGERENAKGWNLFLKQVRNSNFSEKEKEEAAKKAKETFLLFEKAFAVDFKLD